MPETAEQFLTRARAALPNVDFSRLKQRSFGNSAAMAAILVGLVASGEKTGTFALAAEFTAALGGAADQAPKPGDVYLIKAFDGSPVCLYRITATELVPFAGISHEHVQVEGANARNVAIWRKIHWSYWGAMLAAKGLSMQDDTPVIFQRFELLFPPKTG